MKPILFFVLSWISISSLAQNSLTLLECVEIAYENNLRLKNQQIQEKSYEQNIIKAKNDRLPTISGNMNTSFQWGRGIDPFTNTYVNQQFNSISGGFNGNLLLFNGNYHINNIKAQKQDLVKNKSEIQKLKNDILIDVMQQYTNIMYLKEMVENYQKIIDNSSSNLDMIKERISVGNLPEREVYKAISQKESEEFNLITTLNNLSQSWIELKILMNLPIDTLISLAKPLFYLHPDSLHVVRETYIDNAVSYSPEIKIQKSNFEKTKLNLKLAESGFYPVFTLGANLNTAYSDVNKILSFGEQLVNNRSNGIQLNAQIPIFNRVQTRNQVRSAKIDIERQALSVNLEEQNVKRIFYRAFNDFETSKKKYALALASLKSNRMNYDTDRLKYVAGLINLQELNISKTNLSSAIATASQAKYEMFFNYQVLKIYQGEEIWDSFR